MKAESVLAEPVPAATVPRDERPGAAYFRWRGYTPIPLYAAVLFLPWRDPRPWLCLALGGALIALGGLFRLWAIRFIGHRARTHSQKLRPLVTEGPYAACRNPLYIANILIAAGFTAAAGLLWYAPALAALLLVHYHLVVRCEERGLRERHPEAYAEYAARVPRWFPRLFRREVWARPAFSLAECLYRERSGLLGVSLGLATVVGWAILRSR